MLLELFQWLGEDIRAFQVFNYLSLRAVMAAFYRFCCRSRYHSIFKGNEGGASRS